MTGHSHIDIERGSNVEVNAAIGRGETVHITSGMLELTQPAAIQFRAMVEVEPSAQIEVDSA